jgi:hypothetical protein
MTDDASPENLRKFLESDDPAMVRMGLSMAKGAGVKITVKDLERFLKSKDPTMRRMVLSLAKDSGVPEELYKNVFGLSLWDPKVENREAAGALVEEIGLENITEFPGWLMPFDGEEVDDEAREHAAMALVEIGDARAVEPLIGVLSDEDDGYVYGPYSVYSAVVEALGGIGDARAVEPLIELLEEDNWNVRSAAAKALENIGEPAIEDLIGALDSSSVNSIWVYEAAAKALGGIGEPAVEPLINALGDEVEYVREGAASALGEIGDARAVEPLIEALGDEDYNAREAAKEALKKLGHEVE